MFTAACVSAISMLPVAKADARYLNVDGTYEWFRSFVTEVRGQPHFYSTLRASPDELSTPGSTFFFAESQGWEPSDNEAAEKACRDECLSSLEKFSDYQAIQAGPANGHNVSHTVIGSEAIGVFTDAVACHTAGTHKSLYLCHQDPAAISLAKVHTVVKIDGKEDEMNELILMCHDDKGCHIVTPGDVFFFKTENSPKEPADQSADTEEPEKMLTSGCAKRTLSLPGTLCQTPPSDDFMFCQQTCADLDNCAGYDFAEEGYCCIYCQDESAETEEPAKMVSSGCAEHRWFGPDVPATLCQTPPSDDFVFCSQTCLDMDNCAGFSMDPDEGHCCIWCVDERSTSVI